MGVTFVAAPVVGADGTAVAAISITGWINRLDPDRLAPAVRTAAIGVSRVLRERRP
jgi:DNA-binding IclR family transcriptional regulator